MLSTAVSLVAETLGTGVRRLASLMPMKFSSLPGLVFAEVRVEVEAKDRIACLVNWLMLLGTRERTAAIGPDIVSRVATHNCVVME